MSALQNIRDQIQSLVARVVDQVRRSLFGANNERIDFLMDSFYKLSPQHQTGVLAGIAGMLLVFLFGAFGIYFTRINALEDELNASFDALQEVRAQTATYDQELRRYQELKSMVSRSAADFKPKPFFESKANQVGVAIADLRSQDTEIPAESPLSQDFRYVSVEFKLPKVSLPRLLKFIEEVEKGNSNLNIHSLQVRTRYGDRLFFETSAKVMGYKVGGG
jgi:hypothetical protein